MGMNLGEEILNKLKSSINDRIKFRKNKIKQVSKIRKPTSFNSLVRGRHHYQEPLKSLYIDGGSVNNAIITDHIEVVREPDSPYDENSIYVTYKRKKIGYIPRDRNKELKNVKKISNVCLKSYYYKEKYTTNIYFDYK